MRVLVTGGTGNLGKSIALELVQQKMKVTVGSRSGNGLSEEINGTILDYNNPETFEPSLENIDSILLMAAPMDPFSDKKLIPFIDKVIEKGIKSIVLISALGVDANPEAGLYKIEKHLEGSGLNYSIVRPNFFMDNFTSGFASSMIKNNKAIYLSAAKGKTSFIATKDIAKAVSIIFKNIEQENTKVYNLTGAEALDHDQVAEVLSDLKEDKISYVAISRDEMKKASLNNGDPEESANMMLALYDATAAGYLAIVTNDYKKLTGEEPTSFADFVKM